MKKMIGLMVGAAFLLMGCNETPKQEAAATVQKKEAVPAAIKEAAPQEAAPAPEAPAAIPLFAANSGRVAYAWIIRANIALISPSGHG